MLLWTLAALAAGTVVVRSGDTVESLSGNDPELARQIRALNALGDDGVPPVGSVLRLPDTPGVTVTGGAVLAVYGSGTVTLRGGQSAPFEVGVPLPEGSVVCTGPDAFATVRLALASSGRWHDDVNLLGNTCVVVESAVSAPAARSSVVEVQRGSVSVRTAEAGSPGRVTVRTAFGVTSGEGGGFRVHVEPEAARTEALYRPVAVFGGGVELPLAAGQGSRVRAGEAPSAPVDLLVPGMPTTPDDGAPLRVPSFAWGEVEHSLGYRVELAVTPDFSDLVVVEDVSGSTWDPELLLLPFRVDGVWWRVATFDRFGFLGVPSDGRALRFPAGVGP